MNRRSFLTTLGLGASASAFDPERLLWVPGAKTIFIPEPAAVVPRLPDSLFSSTMGFCGTIPIPLSAVDGTKMGPLFEQGGNIYRIVELLPDHHVHCGRTTIYAIPGGKLQVMVRGFTPQLVVADAD